MNIVNRRRFIKTSTHAITASYFLAGLTPGALAQSEPIVETQYGKVRGRRRRDGVYAFTGIRYGADTSGVNRFRVPQPAAPWPGIVDAIEYGPSAPQTNPDQIPGGASFLPGFEEVFAPPHGYQNPVESEDCLFLNIWTTGLNDGRKRPVMFWTHGGAFMSGSGTGAVLQGTNLAKQGDVVFVTVNHRLNAFGYSHFGDLIDDDDYALSGNVGMLDIVAALQWVQHNIERFGGDPTRVMIFGESGGGQKVSWLLGSPAAQGLFTRAVIESGPGVQMLPRAEGSRGSEVFLQELKLDKASFADIQKLSTKDLLRGYFAASGKLPPLQPGFVSTFSPVIDPQVLPQHPFYPNAPRYSKDVPVIVGWNKTEMTLFLGGIPGIHELTDAQMRERLTKEIGNRYADAAIPIYREEYPDYSPSDIYFKIISDIPNMIWSFDIAARRDALGSAATYVYRFDWETPILDGHLRSPHTLEIPFVMNNIKAGRNLVGPGDTPQVLADKMSEAWLAFAANGNPNTDKSQLPQWPEYEQKNRSVMVFDNGSTILDDPWRATRNVIEPLMRERENANAG